jgi:predicted anti-sigma-YlaC factor YlaD
MQCRTCREAISARLDGEDPAVPAERVTRHLDGCASCRSFEAGTQVLRRRTVVRGAEAVPDLTEAVLARADQFGLPARVAPVPAATVAPAAARSTAVAPGAHWSRWALLTLALVQVALSVPSILFGHDATAPVHIARELGSWYLALSAALVVVAIRPARAAGLLPFAAALAVVMLASAVADVLAGRTAAGSESQHLLEVAAVGLLWIISRRPAEDEPLLGGLLGHRQGFAA